MIYAVHSVCYEYCAGLDDVVETFNNGALVLSLISRILSKMCSVPLSMGAVTSSLRGCVRCSRFQMAGFQGVPMHQQDIPATSYVAFSSGRVSFA